MRSPMGRTIQTKGHPWHLLAMPLALAVMLAVVLVGARPVGAAHADEITSPGAGEIIVAQTLELRASIRGADENPPWRVRFETCDAVAEANRAGNGAGFNDAFDLDDGHFVADLDLTEPERWAPGDYCFVLNPSDGPRLTQEFSIAMPTATIFSEHGGESVDGQIFAAGETYSFQTGVRDLVNPTGKDLRLVADGALPGDPIGPGEDVCIALFGFAQCVDIFNALGTATDEDGEQTFVDLDLTIEEAAPPGEWRLRYFLVEDPFAAGDPSFAMAEFSFLIVDEWTEIGGSIRHEPANVRGNSPTHVFDGFVGTAGAEGIVGSITVDYRDLDDPISCTFTPGAGATFELRAAAGIGVTELLVAEMTGFESDCDVAHSAQIIILDKDASEDFPRGAIVVRPTGSPDTGELEIDGSPGETGADSWMPLDRGNAHVGGGS